MGRAFGRPEKPFEKEYDILRFDRWIVKQTSCFCGHEKLLLR